MTADSEYSVVHPTWVRTPMIQALIERNAFKDTVVEPETVADAVVRQLFSGYGSQIIVPPSFWWTSAIRGMPSWLQVYLRDTVSLRLLQKSS